MKETKRVYDRISDDLDSALTKNAQAQKTKPSDIEEVNNVLTATRSAFGHTALDYVFQVESAFLRHLKALKICATRVFFPSLFSCNFDDQLSPNFHRYIILCMLVYTKWEYCFLTVTKGGQCL